LEALQPGAGECFKSVELAKLESKVNKYNNLRFQQFLTAEGKANITENGTNSNRKNGYPVVVAAKKWQNYKDNYSRAIKNIWAGMFIFITRTCGCCGELLAHVKAQEIPTSQEHCNFSYSAEYDHNMCDLAHHKVGTGGKQCLSKGGPQTFYVQKKGMTVIIIINSLTLIWLFFFRRCLCRCQCWGSHSSHTQGGIRGPDVGSPKV